MTLDLMSLMPFAQRLGIRIHEAGGELVVASLDWAQDLTTATGAMHGGALMTLADSAGAACAFLNLPAGANTSTTTSSTVFLRGVREGTVTATAQPLHVGRSTITVRTELRDGDGRLVAQVTQTQAVLAAS